MEKRISMSETRWWVAHTKPRREKKLADYCRQQDIVATLPCYDAPHKYRGKVVVFHKPLFPGYVFLQLSETQRGSVRQNEHVANLLEVYDQEVFFRQLEDILIALDSKLEIRVAPAVHEGMRVRIKSGPLKGLEGWVEGRRGMTTVYLRLDFINQAAAVTVDSDQLVPA